MKNKSFIVILTILITFFCVYFISFTYKSREIQNEATVFATNSENAVDFTKKQYYLDSIWNLPVYNFLGIEHTYKEVKRNEINLGLDLQGGMHVVLEVSPSGIIEALAGKRQAQQLKEALKMATENQKNSQEKYTTLFYEAFKKVSPGTALNQVFSNSSNMDRINTNTTDQEVLKILDAEIDLAVERSLTILRSRIDKFGVTQPNIQQLKGSNRIQVELAGVDNPKRVRKLLQGVAKLEFLETYRAGEVYDRIIEYNNFLYEKEQANKVLNNEDTTSSSSNLGDLLSGEPAKVEELSALGGENTETDSTTESEESNLEDALASDAVADTTSTDSSSFKRSKLLEKLQVYPYQSDKGAFLLSLTVKAQDKKEVLALLSEDNIKGFFPKYTQFLPSATPRIADDGTEYFEIYPIKRLIGGKAPVNGDVVTQARADIDPQGRGYEVSIGMNPSGAADWARLTKELGSNPDLDPRMVAIVLDEQVYSAPRVMGEIPNGRTSITGSFGLEEANDLANILKAGSLPAKLRIVEEVVVGPSIGKESVSAGLKSIITGLALVLIFMILYYHKGGAVANVSLFVNIFFIIGMLAQFGASLTLPGLAGIVLTIGMSIDANVLIFERIKEELALGKKPLVAIDNGFDKALITILDSNITTFITGAILAYFGSGPVKGFAITLMIGLACSFFTAVFVSRLIISWMARKNEGSSLKFDTFLSKGLLKNANFSFVSKRKMAYIFSGIIIVLGLTATVINGGLNLGLDFKGGRSYVVNFDKEIASEDVKKALVNVFEEAGTEVKIYGVPERLKVSTSYLVDEESEESDEKVLVALNTGLSQFSDSNPTVISSSKIGATIADDIKSTSVTAMVISIFLIFLYIVIRFRKWQFGMGAIIALVHDVLIVLSVFSIARMLGLSFEIDQIFIAAILTIIGYSINDTVVVFDRVREFLTEKPTADTAETFNSAINSTLSRTLMTSLTTLIVVVILFIFGGEALKGFSFALLVGILFGTYSSIFIATPVVLDTALRSKKKE